MKIIGCEGNFVIRTAISVAGMPGMIAAYTDRMQIFSTIMKNQRRLHGSQQQDHQQQYGKYPFHASAKIRVSIEMCNKKESIHRSY
jgi:hypothetical protein